MFTLTEGDTETDSLCGIVWRCSYSIGTAMPLGSVAMLSVSVSVPVSANALLPCQKTLDLLTLTESDSDTISIHLYCKCRIGQCDHFHAILQ